jgi:hypothetical protein
MPLTQSLLILAIALASADLGFARADAPSGKNSLKSTTVVAVDPVAFNFVDGEPIHYTVYKTVPKNP